MEFNLDKFLDNKNPICREERQYALFLFNCLDKARACGEIRNKELLKLFDDAGEKLRIKGVYYEATFMRDFFWADRDVNENTFNNSLYNFLYGKSSCLKKISVNNSRHVNKWALNNGETKPYLMQFMMNAKPDIAVWYSTEMDNVVYDYLSFFECKYESYEDKYSYIENEKSKSVSQTTTQMLILMFLCGYSDKAEYKDDINDSELLDLLPDNWKGILSKTKSKTEPEIEERINAGHVKLVKFMKNNNSRTNKKERITINIQFLLEEGRG